MRFRVDLKLVLSITLVLGSTLFGIVFALDCNKELVNMADNKGLCGAATVCNNYAVVANCPQGTTVVKQTVYGSCTSGGSVDQYCEVGDAMCTRSYYCKAAADGIKCEPDTSNPVLGPDGNFVCSTDTPYATFKTCSRVRN